MSETLMRAIAHWSWWKRYKSYRSRFNRRWAVVGSLQHSIVGPFARMVWDLRRVTWRGRLRPTETEYDKLHPRPSYDAAVRNYVHQVEREMRRSLGVGPW